MTHACYSSHPRDGSPLVRFHCVIPYTDKACLPLHQMFSPNIETLLHREDISRKPLSGRRTRRQLLMSESQLHRRHSQPELSSLEQHTRVASVYVSHASRWPQPGPLLCCGCSVIKSYPSLWEPMDWCTPGLPVLHHLLELAQTHVHWASDAIQPSHPLSSPSLPTFNLSQHQGLI